MSVLAFAAALIINTPSGAIGSSISFPNGESVVASLWRRLRKGTNHTYFGFNPNDDGKVTVVGFTNGTNFTVTNLENGQVVFGGIVERGQRREINLFGTRYLKVSSENRLQAMVGNTDTVFGGSLVFPADEGVSRVGNNFSISIPHLNQGGDFVIFAYEGTNVTIRNAANAVVSSFSLPSSGYWRTGGAPLQQGEFYTVQSSGRACIQWIAPNGNLAIPSSTGAETGRRFLFGTHDGNVDDGGAVAVFAYEDANFTITNLDTGTRLVENLSVSQGRSFYRGLVPRGRWKLESTGNVSVWSGGTQGGDEIAEMGDDITQNFGSRGQVFHLHSQNGAVAFAAEDATSLHVDYFDANYELQDVEEVQLNANGTFTIRDSFFVKVTSNKPITVHTVGGALFPGLDDWGKILTEISSADDNDPETAILTGPVEGSQNKTPVTFTWTGFDIGTPTSSLFYETRRDNLSWSGFSPATSRTFTTADLADGPHKFEVRSKDLDGRIDPTPAVRNFIVDNTPPIITALDGVGRYYDATISWVTNEPADSCVEYGLTASYGSKAANSSLVLNHSIVLTGLESNKVYFYRVRSKDAAGNERISTPRSVSTLQIADLEVSAGTTVLPEVWTDRAFEVDWTLLNRGPGAARGPWIDSIAFSSDAQPGGDQPLASYGFSGTINANDSVQRVQPVTVPRNAITTEGLYYLIITTDSGNTVEEGDQEGDNWRAIPINVRITPLPDLIVEEIIAPDTARAGQTIGVQFTVKNVGGAPTDASSWYDFVYLSLDDLPEIEDNIKVSLLNGTSLGISALDNTYTSTALITIPPGTVGQYRVLVWTDSDGSNHYNDPMRVFESNESNNWQTNRVIRIDPPLHADFQVTNVQAQDEVFAGDTIHVAWNVQNRGTAPNLESEDEWFDSVYLSRDRTLSSEDVRIGAPAKTGILALGGGYPQDFEFNVPANLIGSYYAIVFTDSANNVSEYAAEGNNTFSDPVPVHVNATPPDLVVQTLTVNPSARAGTELNVRWKVKNQGIYPAHGPWIDAVYLSDDPIFDRETDQLLATAQGVGVGQQLAAQASYPEDHSVNVTLPDCQAGIRYILVVADLNNTVTEFSQAFDAEANNVRSSNLTLSLRSPDLIPNGLTIPQTLQAGTTVQVAVNGRNQGQGETLRESWGDLIVLTPLPVMGTTVATTTAVRGGRLAANTSYQTSASLVVPPTLQGQYYAWVVLDSSDAIEECDDEGNNTLGPIPVTVNNVLPDLTIESIQANATAKAGEAILVSWTGRNSGSQAAHDWIDSVSMRYPNGERTVLQTVIVAQTVAAGGSWTRQALVTIPGGFTGAANLVVRADETNAVVEGLSEGNNERDKAIEITPSNADLVMTGGQINPSSAVSGSQVNFAWMVQNQGTERTPGGSWSDYVILSRDQILDSNDLALGWKVRAPLDAGGSYVENLLAVIPQGLSGQYYAFFVADRNGIIAENREDNNVFGPMGISLTLPPPVNLTAVSASAVATAEIGKTLDVTYRVRNSSAASLSATWTDAVYLSKDTILDATDPLVAAVPQSRTLSGGQEYEQTIPAPILEVDEANYYVIVRVDARSELRDTNRTDNVVRSSGVSNLWVTALDIGQLFQFTYSQGERKHFKWLTQANDSLEIKLESQTQTDWHDLFLRFGLVAKQSAYDFVGFPNTNRQSILVSSGENSNLYAQALGTRVLQTAAMQIRARRLDLEISEVQPQEFGNTGSVTFQLSGGRFAAGMIVKLVSGSTVVQAVSVQVTSPVAATARFQLLDLPLGTYNMEVLSGAATSQSEGLTAVKANKLKPRLIVYERPSYRRGRPLTITATVLNPGNVDLQNVAVSTLVESDVTISVDRDILTIPRKSDFPDANWELDPPTNLHKGPMTWDSFLMRNLAPGQSSTFTLTIRRISGAPEIQIGATTTDNELTVGEFQAAVQNAYDTAVLSGRDLGAAAPVFQSPDTLWQFLEPALIQFGYIDGPASFNPGDSLTAICLLAGAGAVINELAYCDAIHSSCQNRCQCRFDAAFIAATCAWIDTLIFCATLGPVFGPPCAAIATGLYIYTLVELREAYMCCLKKCNRPDPCAEFKEEGCTYRAKPCEDESDDPNDKAGSEGFGPRRFVSGQDMPFTVNFENMATASAAAQRIVVEDILDENLDLSTLRVVRIEVAGINLEVPMGRSYFATRRRVRIGGRDLFIDATATLDFVTRKAKWVLQAVDPNTGLPPTGVLDGILLPEDGTGRGQGKVQYLVSLASTASTGSEILNSASIVFDTNEAIVTNTVLNTLDIGSPIATLDSLSLASPETLRLTWTAEDDEGGSGIREVEIWARTTGGEFELMHTMGNGEDHLDFTGVVGLQYEFFAIAVDNVGRREAMSGQSETSTQIVSTFRLDSIGPPNVIAGAGDTSVTITGVGFNDTISVLCNNEDVATEYLSPTQVRITIPAAKLTRAALLKISATRSVTLPGSDVFQRSNNLIFTVRRP